MVTHAAVRKAKEAEATREAAARALENDGGAAAATVMAAAAGAAAVAAREPTPPTPRGRRRTRRRWKITHTTPRRAGETFQMEGEYMRPDPRDDEL